MRTTSQVVAARECDHAHDEDKQAQQSEDDIHRRPRIAACRALA